MTFLLVLLFSAASGVVFRLRGSSSFAEWVGRGPGTIRLIWGFALALFAWIVDRGAGPEWWLLPVAPGWLAWPLLGLALYLGCSFAWWGSLDMGRREHTFARDFAMHSLRGATWTLPAAVVVFLSGAGPWWPLALAGASSGTIYALAWWFCPPSPPAQAIGTGPVEMGEYGFGTAIGFALLAGVAFA